MITDIIKNKLKILQPSYINVINESENHIGHSGYNNGNSHFKIIILSKEFEGNSRIKRHKLIYNILAKELRETIHSLSIEAYTESEHKLISNY